MHIPLVIMRDEFHEERSTCTPFGVEDDQSVMSLNTERDTAEELEAEDYMCDLW